MVQLAIDRLLNLPPVELVTPASPGEDADTSFDNHLRQAGRDQRPPTASTARPKTEDAPGERTTPAEAEAEPAETRQQRDDATATAEDEAATDEAPAVTHELDESASADAGVEQIAPQEGEIAEPGEGGAGGAKLQDDRALPTTGEVNRADTATPAGATADAAAQANVPAPIGDPVESAVEETTPTAKGHQSDAPLSDEPGVPPHDEPTTKTEAAGTPQEPATTPATAVEVTSAGGVADHEATESRSGTDPTRRKESGRRGDAAKSNTAVAAADGETTSTAETAIETAADPSIRLTATPQDVALTGPTDTTGAEPPAGPTRAGSVTVAAAERLGEGPQGAKAPSTEPVQTARNTVDTARFVQRVARAFLSGRVEAGREIRLRLHPPELGHLRLQIKVQDGVLTAHMEADNPLAKSLLLDQLAGLRNRLAEHDIKIDRFEVDLLQQPPSGSPDHAASDAQSDRRHVSSRRTTAGDPHDGQPQAEEDRRRWTTGDGQLNIVI